MPASRFLGALAPATLALGLMAAGASATAASLTEGFDVVVPAGWATKNNSTTVGTTGWFQGNVTVFTAHEGATNSYAGANFNNTTGAGTISNWLISPTLSFSNGDVVSFWTRTVNVPAFPDRVELRFSNVGGIDVGTAPTDVGTFALLLSVNPDLTTSGYPNTWTQYTSTITGLAGPTNGAIAFRYFVTSGGPSGDNSDYIGIDSLTITAVPEPATYLLMALGVGGLLLRRSRAARA
ncbi:MAG: choice-of-anchor J domain-containing protein [Rubrivivax sp.]|nr:choice-of-anchor J domain-containing protein [Rubrivivax sp.]